MNILSIETSCDETAVSVVRADGEFPHASYTVLGNSLFSQIEIHKEYGGVFPTLAKREHIKTIMPLFKKALTDAGLLEKNTESEKLADQSELHEILNQETELVDLLAEFFKHHAKPNIDCIAVTAGPGLEPALWVGLNFAKALAFLYDIPVVPINHMEGHVLSSVFDGERLADLQFPALALLISGGHTEFVHMEEWSEYIRIGQTRDDAVGEAFDKAARLIGLPYPGGPEIEKFARIARAGRIPEYVRLPRPMINSGDLDFSFSGLKTAVRYAVQDKQLSVSDQQALARDFEDAVTEVLCAKTLNAIEKLGIHSLIIGGGVSANSHINERFKTFFGTEYPELAIYTPEPKLATDNSIMIALAGHARIKEALSSAGARSIRADGNLSLA